MKLLLLLLLTLLAIAPFCDAQNPKKEPNPPTATDGRNDNPANAKKKSQDSQRLPSLPGALTPTVVPTPSASPNFLSAIIDPLRGLVPASSTSSRLSQSLPTSASVATGITSASTQTISLSTSTTTVTSTRPTPVAAPNNNETPRPDVSESNSAPTKPEAEQSRSSTTSSASGSMSSGGIVAVVGGGLVGLFALVALAVTHRRRRLAKENQVWPNSMPKVDHSEKPLPPVKEFPDFIIETLPREDFDTHAEADSADSFGNQPFRMTPSMYVSKQVAIENIDQYNQDNVDYSNTPYNQNTIDYSKSPLSPRQDTGMAEVEVKQVDALSLPRVFHAHHRPQSCTVDIVEVEPNLSNS
ncbi:hypothetical protein BKA69DRAFT_1101467 [Paraphysoderma sedebokerense]|nr:hypothetical protein BKA69DRAFT_1101467 [Paraphysoderma sedebokerense]